MDKSSATPQEAHRRKRGRKRGYKLPPPTLTPTATIVRPNQLHLLVGISKSTAYRLEAAGFFPKRRQLSTLAVGWLRSELEAWLATRNTVKGGTSI
jgi:predicted DNA-binding transcriptional regulator AlpA